MSKRKLEVRTPAKDRELGIRCRRPERLEGLTLAGDPSTAERYEPTPEHVLSDMLLTLDIDFAKTRFIDLGCGKGRIVCQASLHPFLEVVGVEFARELVDAAQDNLRRMQRLVRAKNVRFVWSDAAKFRFASGPRLVYLYNPFTAPILRQVLHHLKMTSGPTTLLYFEPVHARVVDEDPGFCLLQAQARWSIYRSLPTTGSDGP